MKNREEKMIPLLGTKVSTELTCHKCVNTMVPR